MFKRHAALFIHAVWGQRSSSGQYLVLLLLFLMAQGFLPLLLHPQLSGQLQHALVAGHCLHLVDREGIAVRRCWDGCWGISQGLKRPDSDSCHLV